MCIRPRTLDGGGGVCASPFVCGFGNQITDVEAYVSAGSVLCVCPIVFEASSRRAKLVGSLAVVLVSCLGLVSGA
jgi:hypothetical protein